jgi:hypothetical protein
MNNRNPDQASVAAGEQKMSRRRIIKVAVATAPIIATLPSGAALARSSNVIGSSTAAGSRDASGKTLCLDVRSGTLDSSGTMLDLGTQPRVALTTITERDYRLGANFGATPISEDQMCKQGGIYNYWSYGWKNATVPRGLTVSATALASFAGSIYTTQI